MRLSKKKSCPSVSLQMGESLSPLIEGPVPECEKEEEEEEEEDDDDDGDDGVGIYSSRGKLSSWVSIKSWMKRSSGLQSNMAMKKRMMKKKQKTLNSRVLLLGVLGCPLAPLPAYSSPNPLPLPHLSFKDMCIVCLPPPLHLFENTFLFANKI